MSLIDRVLGKPLATYEEEDQKITPATGFPLLGLDALSSCAYGPEAGLTVLIPLGAAGLAYILPITSIILLLLFILYFSYRQTMSAYPSGGGSYTVAKENLGVQLGLLAAASLLLDYILTVAVGISAGVEALVSAVPRVTLFGHEVALSTQILPLCLMILALLTVVNLRGLRESGAAFLAPTYLFVGSLGIVLVIGFWKVIASGGHPVPVEAPPQLPPPVAVTLLWWLVVRAFASGCTAMTGVEAVSNGITAFKEPRVKNAQLTLTVIIVILAIMLGAIAYLSYAYGIGAMDPDAANQQSVISQLVAAIVGRNWFYFLTLGSTLAILCLSANTSFAGFPRLCQLIAADDFLPRSFNLRGRRLVYTMGITILAVLSAIILIIFGGITDRLIPLYAVGAFGAFTLSQAGMVIHWKKENHSGPSAIINGIGAVSTGIALFVVLVAKFAEGAWITIVIIPALMYVFNSTRKHYNEVANKIKCDRAVDTTHLDSPVVVVPVRGWNSVTEKGLRFGLRVSKDVKAVFISTSNEEITTLQGVWDRYVNSPLQRAGLPTIDLVVLNSPFRQLVRPLLGYINQLEEEYPKRMVAVVIPELVEWHWYHYFLHNQRATWLKAALLFFGHHHVVVVNVPWYLHKPMEIEKEMKRRIPEAMNV